MGICETDFEVLRGDLDYYKSGWAKYPIVPGHEYSGVVARVGPKVKNLKIGDNVVGQCILSCNKCDMCLSGRETACLKRKEVGVLNYNGAYAEYVTLPVRFIHKIPKSLSMVSASSIEPLAVVLKGLNRIQLDDQTMSDKESVLIIGAGPIGNLTARVMDYWGHQITVLDSNKKRLEYLNDLSINAESEVNDFQKFSYIIECTGNANSAKKMLKNSAMSSTMLLLGLPYDKQIVNLEDIVSSDKRIIGSVGSNAKNFSDAINLAPELDLKSFNQSVFNFNQWESAWDEHKNKKKLKVKLKIGS